MKTTSNVAWALATACLAALSTLTSGCADKYPPPPPGVAVIGFVPEYCFWDGYEYVGWYDDDYYYWGPGRVWIICDPIRVERVNVWIQAHPDWRVQAKPLPNVQPRTDADNHPRRLRPPRGGHGFDRDD